MSPKERRRRTVSVSSDRRQGRDRREHERFQATLEIDYACEDASLFGYSGDLSEMGLFIRTHGPYPQGTRLRLTFRPRGKQPFEVAGEVVWVARETRGDGQRPGMGVRFDGLTPEQRDEIARLLQSVARK